MPYLDETGLNTLVEEIKKKTSSVENTLKDELDGIATRVSTLETTTGGNTSFNKSKVVVTNADGYITTSDITSTELNWLDDITGTLGVARGGTGNATHTRNSVLVGNDTDAVKNITSASGALYATGYNREPKFGTLPVLQGGTGATTASAARSNLGITPSNIGAATSSHTHSVADVSIHYGVAKFSVDKSDITTIKVEPPNNRKILAIYASLRQYSKQSAATTTDIYSMDKTIKPCVLVCKGGGLTFNDDITVSPSSDAKIHVLNENTSTVYGLINYILILS